MLSIIYLYLFRFFKINLSVIKYFKHFFLHTYILHNTYIGRIVNYTHGHNGYIVQRQTRLVFEIYYIN
jgi:hypothetical protein